MSLNIVLSKNGEAPEWNGDTSISFSGGSADYWYLWSTLIKEIRNETGQLIDLYDDAEFSGDNLNKVERLIIKQIQELKDEKEEKWEIHIGTEFGHIKKEIYKTLVKEELISKLEKFLAIIQQAKENNEKVICIGD